MPTPESDFHLAQVNVARMVAPIDSPTMADFVALLDEINALADGSPGFVWRPVKAEGEPAYMQPYEDKNILFNLSVWRSLDDLKSYVYRSDHTAVMRRRREWFTRYEGPYLALWWVRAGHLPSAEEAKARLAYLRSHGPTEFAFTFKQSFPPVGAASEPWLSGNLGLCPA
jgi:hypothetical protein